MILHPSLDKRPVFSFTVVFVFRNTARCHSFLLHLFIAPSTFFSSVELFIAFSSFG